nr:hypothetical protein [Tanacetum cinerariifolium]
MWHSIQHGPYQIPMVPNLANPQEDILEPLSKMTEDDKKKYIADVKVMNYILQAIPNDIYNSVDACANAHEMWKQIKSKKRESLESVYERLTTLVNIMDRNNVCPITVAINTKFLNCLQPKWSKYAWAKKTAKNHDPLAIIAHSNASSSHPHAHSSFSPQSYYVTHPPSVLDYNEDYQGGYKGILKRIILQPL